MRYPISEHAHSINNVPGRMYTIHAPKEVRGNMVHLNQTWTSLPRPVTGYGAGGQIKVTMRFDDARKNGHQSFSITADVTTPESRRHRDIVAGGCLHGDIARVFPELTPLIKWHLTSSNGPMHYIANTVYHAGDRDHNGLKAGEVRQIRNGKTGRLCWILEEGIKDLPKYVDSDELPTIPGPSRVARYVPWTRTGEGKARELNAARSSAVWLDATDEELSAPKEDLTTALLARLPGLIKAFKADMLACGFRW